MKIFLTAIIISLILFCVFLVKRLILYRTVIAIDEYALVISGQAYQEEQAGRHACEKKLVQM